jgi:outer membrane murein-binding lipoprotein Lpp
MKTLIALTAAAALISGVALADPVTNANTADPGSAPRAHNAKVKSRANDAPARADTSDPGSAPTVSRSSKVKRGATDNAARANTRDPGSTPTTGSR